MSNPELTGYFENPDHYKIKGAAAAVIAGRADHPLRDEARAYLGKPKKQEMEEEKKEFPDLTGDGKVTQADILKGRGVELDEGEHEQPQSLAKTQAAVKKAKMQGKKPAGKKVEEATETYSVDLDFMKKYVNLKYGEKERTPENIKDLYTQSIFSRGLTKPSRDDLEKMGIKQVDEILGVAAMAGGAAALVALIGKYVGMNQEKKEKLEAYLEANPKIEKFLKFQTDRFEAGLINKRQLNNYEKQITAEKDYEDFEPKKVDEVSTAAGGVVGTPRKEELQESINSILKENKKLIKRLLK
jgi:hypothetical protein